MPTFQFKSNMSKLIRDDELEGEGYKVSPVVLITEGVHNGLLYPAEELAKFPESWNARPVPVYHPTDLEGDAVSAGSPESINKFSIGLVFNVVWDSNLKKLKGEIWINVEKAKALEGGRLVLQMLENDQMIEVSTGLFLEVVQEKGVWNNEAYEGIAVNYRPDHLALLPGKVGACSIQDGAGTPRVNQSKGGKAPRTLLGRVVEAVTGLFRNPATNEFSLDKRRENARFALLDRFVQGRENVWLWIEDMRESSLVYCLESDGESPKFYEIGYTSEGEDISLSSDAPVEVEVVVSYQPVQNMEVATMERDKVVNELIANGVFTKDDVPFLKTLSDERLEGFSKLEVKEPEKTEPEKTEPEKTEPEIAHNEQKLMTEDEFLSRLPSKFRAVLESGVSANESRKNQLVQALKANARCPFEEGDLQKMDLVTLEGMAKLAQVSVSYAGADPGEGVQANEDAINPMPSWDWQKDQLVES